MICSLLPPVIPAFQPHGWMQRYSPTLALATSHPSLAFYLYPFQKLLHCFLMMLDFPILAAAPLASPRPLRCYLLCSFNLGLSPLLITVAPLPLPSFCLPPHQSTPAAASSAFLCLLRCYLLRLFNLLHWCPLQVLWLFLPLLPVFHVHNLSSSFSFVALSLECP